MKCSLFSFLFWLLNCCLYFHRFRRLVFEKKQTGNSRTSSSRSPFSRYSTKADTLRRQILRGILLLLPYYCYINYYYLRFILISFRFPLSLFLFYSPFSHFGTKSKFFPSNPFFRKFHFPETLHIVTTTTTTTTVITITTDIITSAIVATDWKPSLAQVTIHLSTNICSDRLLHKLLGSFLPKSRYQVFEFLFRFVQCWQFTQHFILFLLLLSFFPLFRLIFISTDLLLSFLFHYCLEKRIFESKYGTIS